MTHWGWYWKIKKNHIAKPLCSNFFSIDSAAMFRIKKSVEDCMNKEVLDIPAFHLSATLLTDKYSVSCDAGNYTIPIERQACFYGGFRYYFHCPRCNRRMRILYCVEGFFLCRKCIHAGYISQRRQASRRNLIQQKKIEEQMQLKGGSIFVKPKWMHWATFYKLQDSHTDYQVQAEEALWNEVESWWPSIKRSI